MRILIVDDDQNVYEAVKFFLGKRFPGVKPLYANSFKKAKTILSRNNIDLLLVDYFLGNHIGVELLNDADIPAIILSSSERVLRVLANDYAVINKSNGYLSQLGVAIKDYNAGKIPTGAKIPPDALIPKRIATLMLQIAQIEYETDRIVNGGKHAKLVG